jgi:hypothetical protein
MSWEDAARLKEIIEAIDTRIESGGLDNFHDRKAPLRSRQVVALLEILVERGLL